RTAVYRRFVPHASLAGRLESPIQSTETGTKSPLDDTGQGHHSGILRVIAMSAASSLLVGLVVVLLLGLGVANSGLAAGAAPERPGGDDSARLDQHTLGNPGQVRVTHLDLDLAVDFDRRELKGVAILDFQRQPGVNPDAPLALDTRGLTIDE